MRVWSLVLHPHRVPAAWWFALAAVLVGADYAGGPHFQFTTTFVIPVFLAAWYSGRTPALVLAVILPLAQVLFMLGFWEGDWDAFSVIGSAVLRVAVFAFQAVVIARLARHERDLETEVAMLEGLLPICMHCKSIRNDSGQWETLERYISTRTDATFTHGLCQMCAEKYYPQFTDRRQSA